MPGTTKSDTRSGAKGRRAPKRPVGLRERSPIGVLETLQSMVSRAISSAEELVFLVFFIAFVLFAIGGFLLIYLG
jgi:hypothetical protein